MQTAQMLQEVRFPTREKHLHKPGSLSCLFLFIGLFICLALFDVNSCGLFFMLAWENDES